MLIDDFASTDLRSALGTRWRATSDQVMGGVSVATIGLDRVDARNCLRMQGDVRLENNGGFIQAALDLRPAGQPLDASRFAGLRIVVRGNGERYAFHLRTMDCVRPWQSYRAQFSATPSWQTLDLPFQSFVAHRLTASLRTSALRRIGLVAIGRPFYADVMLSWIGFYAG